MDEFHDLSGQFVIKNRYTNKATGKFVLYKGEDDDLSSELTIAKPDEGSINGIISVRAGTEKDLSASINIMYRGNEHVDGLIEAIAGEYLESFIEVRPHNRLFGKYELVEAPRVEVDLPPIADASTRSRPDLVTINYGDTKSMLTGKNDEESFESFINFGDLEERIPDIKLIESAKLRLYYIDFPSGSKVELYQPNTIWREMGITHANKPYPTELLCDQYTINTVDRYIEFDVLDIAKNWQSESLLNYGLIIKTDSNETLSFFTRESHRPPALNLKYITTKIYSMGRSQLDASIFINGKGAKDIAGSITVHSDVGLSYLESSLYVHKYADPMFYDNESEIGVSRPDVHASLISAYREHSHLESFITVANEKVDDREADILISIPDLYSVINLDPAAHLKGEISVARSLVDEKESSIIISQREIAGVLTVGAYKRTETDLDAELTVKNMIDDDKDSEIIINQPDLWGTLTVRTLTHDDLDSEIDIPYYSNLESDFVTSMPDLASTMMIKYSNQIDAEILVKERSFMDGFIDVKLIDQISGYLVVNQIDETEAGISISVPDLAGTLQPRVIGLNELNVIASIRKRDVSDLNSSIIVRGKSNGSYWFIY